VLDSNAPARSRKGRGCHNAWENATPDRRSTTDAKVPNPMCSVLRHCCNEWRYPIFKARVGVALMHHVCSRPHTNRPEKHALQEADFWLCNSISQQRAPTSRSSANSCPKAPRCTCAIARATRLFSSAQMRGIWITSGCCERQERTCIRTRWRRRGCNRAKRSRSRKRIRGKRPGWSQAEVRCQYFPKWSQECISFACLSDGGLIREGSDRLWINRDGFGRRTELRLAFRPNGPGNWSLWLRDGATKR
jgi:hypothetical protein